MTEKNFIFTLGKEASIQIIEKSNSIAEVLDTIGYSRVGSDYSALRKRCEQDEICLLQLKEWARQKSILIGMSDQDIQNAAGAWVSQIMQFKKEFQVPITQWQSDRL